MAVNAKRLERVGRVTSTYRRKVKWSAYLYLLPAFLLFGVFVVYPVVFNLVLSLNRWNGTGPAWIWAGLDNFVRLFKDRVVSVSLRNSAIFVLGHLVSMALGLILAVLLKPPSRGHSIVRTVIFLPAVLAPTIVAVTWNTIYNTSLGPLNAILRALSLGTQDWLGNPQLAIWSVAFVGIWAGLGFPMIIYLASLQSINPDISGAARVDGANRIQEFRFITLPLLRNTHLVLLMLGVIAAVQAFDVPYVLTNGGPFNATSTLTIYTYKSVVSLSDFGYGAALSQFTLALLVILTLAQRFFLREREAN
ncbi:MAG: carbohydrate ABC transporter permease [Aggregatilineales bacterium]